MQRRFLVITSDDDDGITSLDEFVTRLSSIVWHTPYSVELPAEKDLHTLFGSARSSASSNMTMTIEVTFTPTEPCTFEQAQSDFAVLSKAFQIKSVGFGGEDKEWRALFEVDTSRASEVCTMIDNTDLFSAEVIKVG